MQELADLTGLSHGYVRDLECLSIDKTPLLETIGKFADEIKNGMPQIKNSFDQRCKRITENESWMLPKLRSIVSALVLGRKNDLNEKTYSCSVFSDDGHYSDIDVKVMFA